MKYCQIRNIEHICRKSEDKLCKNISKGLRQEQPLTWPDRVRALRADCVGKNRLASELEHKYIHHLYPPASIAPSTKAESLATSVHQSSLPTSQCDVSPQVQGELLVTQPLPLSSVLNQHTLHSAQVMAPNTHYWILYYLLTAQSAHRLAILVMYRESHLQCSIFLFHNLVECNILHCLLLLLE